VSIKSTAQQHQTCFLSYLCVLLQPPLTFDTQLTHLADLVGTRAIMKASSLADHPALHSAVVSCYESPSGASLAQFLMDTLFGGNTFFITALALCWSLKKRGELSSYWSLTYHSDSLDRI